MKKQRAWLTPEITKFINGEFAYWLKEYSSKGADLTKYYRKKGEFAQKRGGDESAQERTGCFLALNEAVEKGVNSLKTVALRDCWTIFLASPELDYMERAAGAGAWADNIEQILLAACRNSVSKFYDEVREALRDTDYKGLRDALTRPINAKGDRAFIFDSKTSDNGVLYSVLPVQVPYQEMTKEEMQNFSLGFRAPTPGIKKPRRVPGTEDRELAWNYSIVRKEAQWFWKEFVSRQYRNVPGLAPIYALYCWIRKYIGAADIAWVDWIDPDAAIRDDKPGDAYSRDDFKKMWTDEEDGNPEKEWEKSHLRQLARQCASRLPREAILVCAMRGSIGATLEETARVGGKTRAEDAKRWQNKLAGAVLSFCAAYPEIRESAESEETFMEKLVEECENFAFASINR